MSTKARHPRDKRLYTRLPPELFDSPHAPYIEALGGQMPVSRALGLANSTVAHWRDRGIPALYWPRMLRLAAERGVTLTLDQLVAGAARERYPAKRKPGAKPAPPAEGNEQAARQAASPAKAAKPAKQHKPPSPKPTRRGDHATQAAE